MPKQKTNKTIAKRFKKTAKGKLLRKHITISHLRRKETSRKETSSQKRRKSGFEDVHEGFAKKLKKLI